MRYFANRHGNIPHEVAEELNQIADILNERIDFAENIRGALVEATLGDGVDIPQITTYNEDGTITLTPEPYFTVETKIFHGLGYVPMGFIVINRNGPGEIWGSRVSEWNREELFLASNVVNLKVRLFVM